ncbi:MAG: hypothetical protein HYR52_06425, partial [Candidatus Tectomicrobia bacterium]|nr:hypothetical protein [Candidatus Tectomicrobia bacterium]
MSGAAAWRAPGVPGRWRWKSCARKASVWASACRRCGGVFDLDRLEAECARLDRLAGEAGFWNDPEAAQNTLR